MRLAMAFRISFHSVGRGSSKLQCTVIAVGSVSRHVASLSVECHLFEYTSHNSFPMQANCIVRLIINSRTLNNRKSVHIAIRHCLGDETIFVQCEASRVAQNRIPSIMNCVGSYNRRF